MRASLRSNQESTDFVKRPWLWITHPFASERRSSKHFRELDRIYLGGKGIDSPARPVALAHSLSQGFFVTLQNANQVVQFNEKGEKLGPLRAEDGAPRAFCRPQGIGIGSDDRVWISELGSHCIKILDTTTNKIETLDDLAVNRTHVHDPVGMHGARDGSMLIADTGNNRVLSVQSTGAVKVICDRVGYGLGEFRHPYSFCAGNSDETFWVVDRRNHRLQEMDFSGNPCREIGIAGFGIGCLLLPEFAAIFEDGTLVIDEWSCTKAVKMFSPEGEELDSLRLDYAPRGMLVHDGLLFVCEWSGDHVYVYERI